MDWDEPTAREEARWLRLMSRFKYDAYSDFVAGARFTGSLIQWLRQFEPADRPNAYRFFRDRLVFVSAVEMQRLVEAFYPVCMERKLIEDVALSTGKPKYDVALGRVGKEEFEKRRLTTLIVGMSEGARLDPLRRANMGTLSHEQMLPSVEMDGAKWKAVLKKMRKAVKDEKAAVSKIFLIDDFVASGTTFLRQEDDGTWDGKLIKLLRTMPKEDKAWIVADCATIHVHHYIGSDASYTKLNGMKSDAEAQIKKELNKDLKVDFSFGWRMPKDVVASQSDPIVKHLVTTYYSRDIEVDANLAGGGTTKDIRWGYKKCALTVVLEHNTPNNSLPLIWGQTEGKTGHTMRALFRRRQRHG
jgi:hypothetical protein